MQTAVVDVGRASVQGQPRNARKATAVVDFCTVGLNGVGGGRQVTVGQPAEGCDRIEDSAAADRNWPSIFRRAGGGGRSVRRVIDDGPGRAVGNGNGLSGGIRTCRRGKLRHRRLRVEVISGACDGTL